MGKESSKIEVSSAAQMVCDAIKYTNGRLTTTHTSNNEIITSRYNKFNFFPKSIWEQFRRPANAYFLMIGMLQCIKDISPTDGKPMIAMPLIVVITVAIVKSGYEDWKRHKSDDEENSRRVLTVALQKEESNENNENI